MNLFFSSTTGRNEPFESTTCNSREEWVETVKSLVPEGFSGVFRVFGTFPNTEEKDEYDLSGEPFPVFAFNGYGKDGLGLGSIDCPEEVPNLEMHREDLVLYCRHVVRLAGQPVTELYLSNDPDSPEILTLEFEYGAPFPGSFNIQVSPLKRVELPYIDEPFFLHDLWLTLPLQGWVPFLVESFMKESGFGKLDVRPRAL